MCVYIHVYVYMMKSFYFKCIMLLFLLPLPYENYCFEPHYRKSEILRTEETRRIM